jgi:hypothetical protein
MRPRKIALMLAIALGCVVGVDLALATWAPFLYRKPPGPAGEQSWAALLHRPSEV